MSRTGPDESFRQISKKIDGQSGHLAPENRRNPFAGSAEQHRGEPNAIAGADSTYA